MYKDLVVYDIGDAVISKNGKSREVYIVKSFKFIGDSQYQVLYFEDPPKTAHVANDFYPADEELRGKYLSVSKLAYGKKSAQTKKDIDKIIKSKSKTPNITFKLKPKDYE
jgi:hypothetical protein